MNYYINMIKFFVIYIVVAKRFQNKDKQIMNYLLLDSKMKMHIKYLFMDVDGTLTDGKIYIGNDEEMFKAFNIKDGCGIHDILIPNNVIPVVVTGRTSKIVELRCRELGITELYQGILDKQKLIKKIVGNELFSSVAYIGDDINDLECMTYIKKNGGIVGCPSNASIQVVSISDFVSNKAGGDGAVREFIDWLVKKYVKK